MDGIIPLIYNAIKRKRSRTYYQSLSTRVPRGFEASEFRQGEKSQLGSPPRRFGSFDEGKAGRYESRDGEYRQKHRSMEDFSSADYSSQRYDGSPETEVRRSGSLRIFTCSGGF